MTFLTPVTGAILAAALIPPLLLLYFLKLRRRSAPIASTFLWQQAVEDLHANAPFQRLRRNLLLLLQLLALLLLAMSIMQPQIEAFRRSGGRSVIMIDNSASMNAVNADGVSRLEEAKKQARDQIEAVYGGGLFRNRAGETMILSFSDQAQVAASFSRSKQELLNAIDRIRPTHGPTRLDDALKLARAYTTTTVDADGEAVEGGEAPTLELFSDGRISDLASRVLRNETLIYHPIGEEEADNVAIGTIAVERPYDQPTSVAVFSSVLNFNEQDVSVDVELRVDDRVMAVEEVDVAAASRDDRTGELVAGRSNVLFTPFEQPRGALIEVISLRDDDLPADDAGRLVVAPPRRLAIGLVAPQSFLIRTVLEGLPLERIEILSAAQYERALEEGGLDRYDVIVFDNFETDQLAPGRYLTFGPTPPLEGLNEFGSDESQVVINAREDHPALRFVQLDRLYVADSWLLQPDEAVDTLVEGNRGPLMIEASNGQVHLLHLSFDPLESNWPYQRSFVTFMFNAIDYLGHLNAGISARGFSIGDALTTRLPEQAENIMLEMPDGATEPLLPSDPTKLSWGPIRLSGVYTLRWDEPGAAEEGIQHFAVNLDAAAEGNIAIAPEIVIGQDRVEGVAGRSLASWPLWPWAIGLSLVVLMLEWWVYHRRTYI